FLFFFSSRSRHTRFSRDWSSDVCSSDLGSVLLAVVGGHFLPALGAGMGGQAFGQVDRAVLAAGAAEGHGDVGAGIGAQLRQPGVDRKSVVKGGEGRGRMEGCGEEWQSEE